MHQHQHRSPLFSPEERFSFRRTTRRWHRYHPIAQLESLMTPIPSSSPQKAAVPVADALAQALFHLAGVTPCLNRINSFNQSVSQHSLVPPPHLVKQHLPFLAPPGPASVNLSHFDQDLATSSASQRFRSGSLTAPSTNLSNAFGPSFFSTHWQPTRSGLSNMTSAATDEESGSPSHMGDGLVLASLSTMQICSTTLVSAVRACMSQKSTSLQIPWHLKPTSSHHIPTTSPNRIRISPRPIYAIAPPRLASSSCDPVLTTAAAALGAAATCRPLHLTTHLSTAQRIGLGTSLGRKPHTLVKPRSRRFSIPLCRTAYISTALHPRRSSLISTSALKPAPTGQEQPAWASSINQIHAHHCPALCLPCTAVRTRAKMLRAPPDTTAHQQHREASRLVSMPKRIFRLSSQVVEEPSGHHRGLLRSWRPCSSRTRTVAHGSDLPRSNTCKRGPIAPEPVNGQRNVR